ncbi:MAG: biotin--[acetyl-CoA-carboxylase] ligase [Bacteroidales bacterium]|jgi:BirA family biotin operon repressor/biotin-[acetyl-CoA-carboxylase] ligase|nr:biotin--[acetyl-CoA-carboxylase] ligase [Bacteroidales bacterium]
MKEFFSIKWHPCLDSTQDFLLSLDEKDIFHFLVIATKNQTCGRGQGDNVWESEKDKTITFSLALEPQNIRAEDQFVLTQIVSLSILDYLKTYLDNVFIKWPNDIYIGENKICGILIQNKILGQNISKSVVGIGLNVNQTYFSLAKNATSLKNELKKEFIIEEEMEKLLLCIKYRYERYKEENDLKQEYLSNLLYYNKWNNYIYKQENIRARIIDVNSFGHLILEKEDKTKIIAELRELKFIIH